MGTDLKKDNELHHELHHDFYNEFYNEFYNDYICKIASIEEMNAKWDAQI